MACQPPSSLQATPPLQTSLVSRLFGALCYYLSNYSVIFLQPTAEDFLGRGGVRGQKGVYNSLPTYFLIQT